MLIQAATLVYGLVIIAGMLAVIALCFYMIWWVVMIVVSFIPIIGKRHRHDRWDEFQRAGSRPLSARESREPVGRHGPDEPTGLPPDHSA